MGEKKNHLYLESQERSLLLHSLVELKSVLFCLSTETGFHSKFKIFSCAFHIVMLKSERLKTKIEIEKGDIKNAYR